MMDRLHRSDSFTKRNNTMSKRNSLPLFLFILWGLIISCSDFKRPMESTQSVVTNETDSMGLSTKGTLPIDSVSNDYARVLSGMDSSDNHLTGYMDKVFLRNYCSEVGRKVSAIETSRLLPIRKWNDSNMIRNQQNDTLPCLYPLSGGDFLHAAWMYPNASVYHLMALEKVGSIPDFSLMKPAEINGYLSAVDYAFRDIYSKSYFMTKNMHLDTRYKAQLSGMLPMLLWSVARTGHEVIAVQQVSLDSSGQVTLAEWKPWKGNTPVKGVQITMRNQATSKIQILRYFSCDLSEKGQTLNPGIFRYVEQLPQVNTFIKAGSYLLSFRSFTKMRKLVLEKSRFLVQDDTGIPFRYFTEKEWKVELYGVYLLPVEDFSRNFYQKDLAAAYADSSHYRGSLPFSLGYHWMTKGQNQMVITRKP